MPLSGQARDSRSLLWLRANACRSTPQQSYFCVHGISTGSLTAAECLRFCQVAELEAEQVRLQTHCAEVEASCKLLHKEVAEVRGQWQKAVADNSRLKTELHYQRNNVQLGLGMQVKIAAI